MEEVEGLTENSEETIHERAHEGPHWSSWVALTTAILAAMAAVAAFLSGHNETEAMLDQLKSSDQWSYYEAKGIKSKQDEDTDKLQAEIIQLQALVAPKSSKTSPSATGTAAAAPAATDAELAQNVARYKEEQEKIKEQATDFEKERDVELGRHETFSKGVILFQVAIAVGAIAILMKKRRYWAVSLAFGLGGVLFLVIGLLQYLKH